MSTLGYDIGDQPITGYHLIELQQLTGLDIAEMIAALGISYPKWFQITRSNPHEPVADPDLALMIWVAYTFPEEAGFLPPPTPKTIFDKFKDVVEKFDKSRRRRPGPKKFATHRMFALIQGREGASGYRWLSDTESKPISTNMKTRRLMTALYNVLCKHGVKGLDLWLKRVSLEVEQRHVEGFWERARWQAPKTKKSKPNSAD